MTGYYISMSEHKHGEQLIFPWRKGNTFELLIDAPQFYPAMLQDIAAARHYILLESYLMESGQVMDDFILALQQAVQRGVRVFVIFDDLGSSKLTMTDRERLQSAGLQLLVYNPLHPFKIFGNVYRNHRKQLTIDGAVTITGGMGISDEFDPRYRDTPWRETGIRIEGPMVNDWQVIFARTWQHGRHSPLPINLIEAVSSGSAHGRLSITQGGQQNAIKGSVIHQVRRAKTRVWIATAYFMPSRKLRRVLREADRRGVDVRILLPGPLTDHPSVRYAGRRYYGPLLRAGVRIYEYQPRFIHAKTVLCDEWVSLGSANLDRWSFRWTLEANQEVHDPDFTERVASQFMTDLEHCEEIDYYQWRRRSLRTRLHEWLWGGMDHLVEFLHNWLQLERLNPWRRNK